MTCPAVIEVVTPGPSGPAGAGAAWQQGSGVPDAGLGSNGDFYLNSNNGDIYGPKTAGAWGSVIFNIAEGQTGPQGPTGATGAAGPAGADGRTLLSGTSAPGGGTGADGDFYIDTAADAIYGPKSAGAWGSPTSLIGPQGPAGADGADGAAGATGPQGPQGPAGATGPQGPAGSDATATPLSDATPQAPGTAAAGTASSASRSDHVHALPPLVSSSTAGLAPATSYAAIAYAADVELDMAILDGQLRTISLTGNLSLTSINRALGRRVVLRLICDSTQRTLTFPSGWVFVGSKPANIAASKTAVLSLTFFGTASTDAVVAYGVQS